MTHCKDMSIVMLERFLAQDLNVSDHQLVQKHLLQCHVCPVLVSEYEQQKVLFNQSAKKRIWNSIEQALDVQPQRPLLVITVLQRLLRQPQTIFIPVVAICLIFILLPFIDSQFQKDTDLTRIKSGTPQIFSLNFLKKGKDNIIRYGITEDFVHPGDIIQLSYTAVEDGYLMIVGRLQDESGNFHTEIYFPSATKDQYESTVSEKIELGNNVNIPYGLELDDILGDEMIVGIFSPQPFQLKDIDFVFDETKDDSNFSQTIFTSVIVLHKRAE